MRIFGTVITTKPKVLALGPNYPGVHGVLGLVLVYFLQARRGARVFRPRAGARSVHPSYVLGNLRLGRCISWVAIRRLPRC